MTRPLAPLTLCPDYSKLSLTGDLSLPLDCELCEGRGQVGLSHKSPSPTQHQATPGVGRYSGFVAELTLPCACPPASAQAQELEGYMCLVDHALAQREIGMGKVGEGL